MPAKFARLELRLYDSERAQLDSACAAAGKRPTEVLRQLASLDYCDKSAYEERGEGRCARVLVCDAASYNRLDMQLSRCGCLLEQGSAAIDRIGRKLSDGDDESDELYDESFHHCRRINSGIALLRYHVELIALHPCREPGARDARFGLRLAWQAKTGFQRAAEGVGTGASDLLRALAMSEVWALDCYGRFELVDRVGSAYLDAAALRELADDIRALGYGFNTAVRNLNTLARLPEIGTSRGRQLLRCAEQGLRAVEDGLFGEGLSGERINRLLTCPTAYVRRCR